MNTVNKLQELSSRIEHLQTLADWVTKETLHFDNAISQTGTLITVLADEIQERVFQLVRDFEEYTASTIQ